MVKLSKLVLEKRYVAVRWPVKHNCLTMFIDIKRKNLIKMQLIDIT